MGVRLEGRLWAPREWKVSGNAAIGADFSSGTDWGLRGKCGLPSVPAPSTGPRPANP